MLLLNTGIAVLVNQESYVFDTNQSLKANKGSLKNCEKKSVSHTANNFDFDFSYHIYKLSFLNFLLGRQPNGPGKLRMNSKCNNLKVERERRVPFSFNGWRKGGKVWICLGKLTTQTNTEVRANLFHPKTLFFSFCLHNILTLPPYLGWCNLFFNLSDFQVNICLVMLNGIMWPPG